ncbi:NAD-dependent epimerase/dehydratase family protein [Rhizobium leguminosarum]
MKIIIIGGATGLVGGHVALYLKSKGYDVTVAGRTAPDRATLLGDLRFEKVDYINDNAFPHGFDAVVFCAGHDIRARDANDQAYWSENAKAAPRFFQLARDAGVKVAVNIGSFYPWVKPELVERNAYVQARKLSADAICALNAPGFRTTSLNAAFVVGTIKGTATPMFVAHTHYAQGKLAPIPEFSPGGGSNFISTQSLSEAIEGAVLQGEGGKNYLVGDENLTFQQYFGLFFDAARRPVPPVLGDEHPLLPDRAILSGRGSTAFFEPDPAIVARLGYRRNDIKRAVKEIFEQVRASDEVEKM